MAHETLPRRGSGFSGGEETADWQVCLEDAFLLQRQLAVIEERVDLVVDTETAVVKVRRTDTGEVIVTDDGF